MEETYVRIMLAGEADALDRCGVKALSEHLGDRPAEVTVVAVAKRGGVITSWAALSGATTPDRMAEQALTKADRAARAIVSALPRDLAIRHLAVRSWTAAMPLISAHDVIVVVGKLCRRDRRVTRTVPAAVMRWVDG